MSVGDDKMARWHRTPAWWRLASGSTPVPTASSLWNESQGRKGGDGRRTRVSIDGVADPLIASRTEITILRDMGQESAVTAPELDEAMDLAARLAAVTDKGRLDLERLGRRARRLLATTTSTSRPG